MTRNRCVAVALVAALCLAAGGCVPRACVESQRRQLAAWVQYRDEMAAYHGKVRDHLVAEKEAELDTALAATLTQGADDEGRVALADVAASLEARRAKGRAFAESVGRLDAQFGERQALAGRAIALARATLDVMETYARLPAALRNLFVREVEADALLDRDPSARSERDE